MEFVSVLLLHRPDLVEPRKMEEFMVFCTVFLGSTHYVKNAYLR